MAAAVPLIGPVLGLLGQFMGGSDEPKAPEVAAAPPPPAPPPPPKTVDPQEAISQEQERVRGLKRRRNQTDALTSLSSTTSTSKKTLLGE